MLHSFCGPSVQGRQRPTDLEWASRSGGEILPLTARGNEALEPCEMYMAVGGREALYVSTPLLLLLPLVLS